MSVSSIGTIVNAILTFQSSEYAEVDDTHSNNAPLLPLSIPEAQGWKGIFVTFRQTPSKSGVLNSFVHYCQHIRLASMHSQEAKAQFIHNYFEIGTTR